MFLSVDLEGGVRGWGFPAVCFFLCTSRREIPLRSGEEGGGAVRGRRNMVPFGCALDIEERGGGGGRVLPPPTRLLCPVLGPLPTAFHTCRSDVMSVYSVGILSVSHWTPVSVLSLSCGYSALISCHPTRPPCLALSYRPPLDIMSVPGGCPVDIPSASCRHRIGLQSVPCRHPCRHPCRYLVCIASVSGQYPVGILSVSHRSPVSIMSMSCRHILSVSPKSVSCLNILPSHPPPGARSSCIRLSITTVSSFRTFLYGLHYIFKRAPPPTPRSCPDTNQLQTPLHCCLRLPAPPQLNSRSHQRGRQGKSEGHSGHEDGALLRRGRPGVNRRKFTDNRYYGGANVVRIRTHDGPKNHVSPTIDTPYLVLITTFPRIRSVLSSRDLSRREGVPRKMALSGAEVCLV